MAAGSYDKFQTGTPYLLQRQRLEFGIGSRALGGKRDLLAAIHSNQRSMNPVEEEKPENCKKTLSELLEDNENALIDCVRISVISDWSLVQEDEQKRMQLVIEQILNRIDEINYRGKLIENIRPSQGPGFGAL